MMHACARTPWRLRWRIAIVLSTLGVGCGGGGGGTSSVSGPVTVSVASVSVSLATADLPVGGVTQATANVSAASGATLTGRVVTWGSGNPSVATVSASGQVTATGAGATAVTATSEGKSGGATLLVANVAVVAVTPTAVSLYRGQTAALTATAKDAGGATLSGRLVIWSSSDATVASVSASGVVTAIQVGSVSVTARSEGASRAVMTSVALVPVKSVSVTPASVTLVAGEFTQLSATARDSAGGVLAGRTVSFRSSDSTVALVRANGLLVALKAGSATVTATSEGIATNAPVTVNGVGPAVATLKLTSPRVVAMDSGSTTTPTFIARDLGGAVVANPSLFYQSYSAATAVSRAGVVTARAPGQSLIFGVAASNQFAQDSLLAVVVPLGGAVLMTDLSSFELAAGGTNVVVNLVLDLRASGIQLGSANVVASWDPQVLTLLAEDAIGASAVSAIANTTQWSNGVYRLGVTSTSGIGGRVVLRRLTFAVPSGGALLPTQLVTTAIDVNTADTFASVLGRVLSVSMPIVSK